VRSEVIAFSTAGLTVIKNTLRAPFGIGNDRPLRRPRYSWLKNILWHGAAGGKRCSPEVNFLAAVDLAERYAMRSHSGIGLCLLLVNGVKLF